MDAIEAMFARHSVRDFKPDAVPMDKIIKILKAANQSPSTANTQPWQVYIATGEVLERIKKACVAEFRAGAPTKPELQGPAKWPPSMQDAQLKSRMARWKLLGIDVNDAAAIKANVEQNYYFFGAPLLAVICMDHTLSTLSIFDLGLYTQSILLAATDLGLGSIPALNFVAYAEIIRKELNIPRDLIVAVGVAIGYENTDSLINTYRSSRRPLEEVVIFK
jgi:nitroreductase